MRAPCVACQVRKLEQIKAVLEKGGKFEGINRKVQIKPTKWIEQPDGPPEVRLSLYFTCLPRCGLRWMQVEDEVERDDARTRTSCSAA